MNVFAKFDEIPSMTLQDIKETKRYGHTFVRSFVRSDGRTDNVKTVYPPTNTVCGGYNNMSKQAKPRNVATLLNGAKLEYLSSIVFHTVQVAGE